MTVPDLNLIVAHGSDETRSEITSALSNRYTVLEQCGTVIELKQAVLSHSPDLIVSGIWYPDGNGIDTAIEIGNHRPIPCVITTSARSLELVRKAMEDHVMAYLIEPVTREDLDAAMIVAWSRFEQLRDLEGQVEDLKTALEHRKVIERAKGILMAKQSSSESEAFATLRRRAQDKRVRMVDIANQILSDHARGMKPQSPSAPDET